MPRTTVYRFEPRPSRRRAGSAGVLPLVLGGWFGGVALAALALAADLGWLAALLAYSLGGATVLAALAVRTALADRAPKPVLIQSARSYR
jgi:hypothetical protein